MTNFIIFASARTGSTSLAKLLGESPQVKMLIEPFHEDFSKWNPDERNYHQYIKDPQALDEALNEIFTRYTAIKVLDYQFDKKIYFSMLGSRNTKIIFLRRKNVAQSALSSLVAEQTSEYHKQEDQEIYKNLKAIDIKYMQKMVDYVTTMNNRYAKFLEENKKGEYLNIFYEDLYFDDLEENKKSLKVICDFLGIELPPEEVIKKYMLPSEAKINYESIYRLVPNYTEIEKQFGNLT